MLLSVSGTSMVGHDGSIAATARRDDDNCCFPGCSACSYAGVYAAPTATATATSTSTPARSAIEQRQQLR